MRLLSESRVDQGECDRAEKRRHKAETVLTSITRRERFVRACRCLELDYPPTWLMRQAGRCLPEYRQLKERFSFLQLVQTPDLAAEVTLQPIRRFDFDAAIIFSDILVVPEAMGQGYRFRESGGIAMDFALNSQEGIRNLRTDDLPNRLRYVAEAIRLVRRELGHKTALLGFAGSPWTLANFMLEGGSSKTHARALELFQDSPEAFQLLMEKLTDAVAEVLQMQIDAGVDAIQVFDSLGGILPKEKFDAASGQWIRRVISKLNGNAPVILFSKGTHTSWEVLANSGAQVLGIDWMIPMAEARRSVPETIALQGNLDPALLAEATPDIVSAETRRILGEMSGRPGHIFNLGHGVPPNANLENITALLNAVRNGA